MVPGATSPIKETQRQRVLRVFNKKYGINYGGRGESKMRAWDAARVTSFAILTLARFAREAVNTLHIDDLTGVGLIYSGYQQILLTLLFVPSWASLNRIPQVKRVSVLERMASWFVRHARECNMIHGQRFKREWVQEEMKESVERNGGVRLRQVHLTECSLVPMVAGSVRWVASQNDDGFTSPRALPPPWYI